jgi:hypothetical protein
MAKICNYKSKKKTIEMVNLLKEYQYMFAKGYKDFKGMVKKMGEMKIDLMPRARPIKKRPNQLAHKYK